MSLYSILDSVKKQIGIAAEYQDFDDDIQIHVNSVLSILHQFGIGPQEGYSISSNQETWYDFLGEDPQLNLIKSYVGLKVKSIFDPSVSTAVSQSTKQLLDEMEWRITSVADLKKWEES